MLICANLYLIFCNTNLNETINSVKLEQKKLIQKKEKKHQKVHIPLKTENLFPHAEVKELIAVYPVKKFIVTSEPDHNYKFSIVIPFSNISQFLRQFDKVFQQMTAKGITIKKIPESEDLAELILITRSI